MLGATYETQIPEELFNTMVNCAFLYIMECLDFSHKYTVVMNDVQYRLLYQHSETQPFVLYMRSASNLAVFCLFVALPMLPAYIFNGGMGGAVNVRRISFR